MRISGVLLELVVIVLWHRWYLTPAHLAAPALAAGWGAVFAARCLRGRLDRVSAGGELAVTTVLLAAASWSLPPVVAAGQPNWVMLRLGGAGVAIGWCVPTWAWLSCLAVLAAAGVTGFLRAGAATSTVVIGVVGEVVGAAVLTLGASVLRRGAAGADGALVLADARRRAQTIEGARAAGQREAERVLHDTVLNTLVGLAWGASDAPAELLRARCRHSVDRCADLLGIRGEPPEPRPLADRLDEVVARARRDGLTVDVSAAGELSDVPAEVGATLAATVAEALSNVRRHAGVGRAEVAASAEGGGVRITVRDHGRGFDPLAAPADDRLGVQYSIMDRMADLGGSADIATAPGRGTTVTLRWSPDPESAGEGPAGEPPSVAELERSNARAAVAATGLGTLAWVAALGAQLAARSTDYRAPFAVLAAWLLVVATLGWCVVAAGGGRLGPFPSWARPTRLTRRAVGLLALATTGAELVAGLSGRTDLAAPLNWGLLVALGTMIFLQASRPAREWVPVAAVTMATIAAILLSRERPEPIVVMRVLTLLYSEVAFLAVLSVLWRSRRAVTRVAARAARAEADVAAERLAVLAVRRDRRERLRRLADGPLHLMAEIGAGRLDPRDASVRERAAAAAALLRRSLNLRLRGPAPLLRALEPAVADAERRGVRVEVQADGPVDGLASPARDEVVDSVTAALAGLKDGRALLTVLGDPTGGSVSLSFPAPVATSPLVAAAAARVWTELVEEIEEGEACIEISWKGAATTAGPAARTAETADHP